MKKLWILFLVLVASTFLFSCSVSPSMRELLAYQTDGADFDVMIRDEVEIRARICLGNPDRIVLCSGEASGICLSFDGENAHLLYEKTEMCFPKASTLKASRWLSLFRQPFGVPWHIRKESIAGSDIFVCRTDDVTLYIDAQTRLPLKLQKGTCVIDVISCQ